MELSGQAPAPAGLAYRRFGCGGGDKVPDSVRNRTPAAQLEVSHFTVSAVRV